MNVSEQKLNEILAGIINNYGKKGSISTNALCDIMEKYDTNPNQIDHVYKSLAEAGIQIVDEDQRDRELFELLDEKCEEFNAILDLNYGDKLTGDVAERFFVDSLKTLQREGIEEEIVKLNTAYAQATEEEARREIAKKLSLCVQKRNSLRWVFRKNN